MGIIEIKIRKNLEFWFNLKAIKGQVILTSIIMVFVCLLFASCKKDGEGTNTGEDLSYLIQTYYRYESGGHIYKTVCTYEGRKQTSYKHYVDGLLYSEYKNYSYNGLNASYDSYSYRNGDVNDVTVCHYEYEYLDDTYRRTKYYKYYYPDSQDNTNIYETYNWYDGKKKLSSKSYTNGMLTGETLYHYDGLRCTYKKDLGYEERNYEILYLDETYLRTKSNLQTRKRYDSDGNLISSNTYYYVFDYDGKKPIGSKSYTNGKLSSVGRDYQYDGLTCFYFVDGYQDGEVVSTRMYEVEYLE